MDLFKEELSSLINVVNSSFNNRRDYKKEIKICKPGFKDFTGGNRWSRLDDLREFYCTYCQESRKNSSFR